MELPDDAPKTPKLYFLVGDVLLIAVAALIAFRSGDPLPPAAIYAISGCILAGSLLLVLPFLLDYNRRQDALLTERQNALEALVRTTSAAVEQASIAATGLNEIAELAHKNLRAAEQLPHKLHERINEFNRARDDAMAAELESLQQEVNTLRASEAEKLDSAADKVHRTVQELARLEPHLRKQCAALEDAARRAEQALAAAADRAGRSLDEHLARTLRTAEEQLAKAAQSAASPTPVRSSSPSHPARPAAASAEPVPPPVPSVSAPVPVPPAQPPVAGPAVMSPVAAPAPRKPARRHPTETSPPLFPDGLRNDAAPLEGAPERAPDTQPPFPMTSRPPREPAAAAVPAAEAGAPAPAPSADGATRLVVTAYIGIGNKLFIRGDGPGLSWDRGVPLQFVSIGKWRWETTDATRPVSAKLYKNDQVECTGLGTIELQPGQQRELTASF